MKIRSFEECVTCFMGDFIYLDFHMGSVQLSGWIEVRSVFSPSLLSIESEQEGEGEKVGE